MRKMKDSGVDWIDVIPEDWSIVPLKTAVFFGKGLPITKENLIEKGVAVVSYGQIHSKSNIGSHLKEELVRYVSEDYLTSNPSCLARKGDIFVADTSEDYDGIGNSVLIDWDEAVFAGYHTVIISPLNRKYSKYLAYLFMTDAWRNQLRARASGIKVFSVTQGLLRKSAIILPNQNCIQRMTDYLDDKCKKIDSIIARQEVIIEKLKEYKLSMVIETVLMGLNSSVKTKESGIGWIGKIPEHWETMRIKWMLEERKERSASGTEEPLSMSQKYGIIPTKEMGTVPNLASSYVGAKKVYVDDLVFNKLKAHLGVFNVSRYEGLVSPDYAVYYSTGKADLKYLEYVFKTPQCILEFRKNSSGVADGLTRLYTDGLFSIFCPFPPLEEQIEIAKFIREKEDSITKTIIDRETAINKLKEYKKSLIYEVVTGKKEV